MTVMKIVHSDKELLQWYNDEREKLKEFMPAVIDRIESMDRSMLVAECARVHSNLIKTRWMNSSLRDALNSMVPTKEGQ